MKSDPFHRRAFLKAVGAIAATPLMPCEAVGRADTTSDSAGNRHRVLTCNILLDLPEHAGKLLDWKARRRDYCVKVIKARNPDILCLQEVGRGQYEDFVRAFPSLAAFGFPDPYVDTNPPRFQSIKNVIFYSRERYEQTSAGIYWLSETPLVAGSILPGANLPRHVTWLRLKARDGGREFRVLNTHWALKRLIRKREARIVVDEAGPYQPDFPELLAGDFNADRTSPEHKILIDNGWKDTYETLHGAVEPGYTAHRFKGPGRPSSVKTGKIDFIFFRGNIRPLAAEIIRDSKKGLYPSDHYFVSADVKLTD
jgi:endonuclease/exonuclease/phosphatase family metal-dependent hydrolase